MQRAFTSPFCKYNELPLYSTLASGMKEDFRHREESRDVIIEFCPAGRNSTGGVLPGRKETRAERKEERDFFKVETENGNTCYEENQSFRTHTKYMCFLINQMLEWR